MRTVAITQEALAELAAALPRGRPITMLNLLRFRDKADYGAGDTQPPCSGKEAYFERYATAVTPMVMALGARIVWSGVARGHPVCPDDERWDDILIVEYPDLDAILGLFGDPEYQRHVVHRTAALEDSRLVAMEATQPPG